VLTLVTALVVACGSQWAAAQGPPPRQGRGQPPGPPAVATGWRMEAAAQTNLWFHALAVIAADQPGPLGLYSADYARFIRDFKQQIGVYPTVLDSLAPELREAIGDGRDLEVIHFVPLYFPQAAPERMLEALRAVVDRKDNQATVGRDVGFGVFVMRQVTQDGKTRSVLRDLLGAVEQEWNVFYRQYWEDTASDQDSLVHAMQRMWDAELEPGLERYLEERRLAGGIVMPAAALGPEGRIVELQDYNPGDQVQPDSITLDEREDLRRTAAVRCGAQLLQFYAPEQVGRYRRAFLDAVGAEESNTVEAFERVYYLDPTVLRRLHQQIQRQ
jgi:hypothetical protein